MNEEIYQSPSANTEHRTHRTHNFASKCCQ